LLQNQSVQFLQTETDERATPSLGMKHFKAVNQLLAFELCFGEGGVYAAMNYDDLHLLYLGLFVLILSWADLLFCRYFKRTSTMQTYEDVHNLVECLVGLCPGMNDGVHILKWMKMGWRRLESWNGVDTECFLTHLLFIFSTHDSLIEDEDIRRAFAGIVRAVYSLYVRFKVKKVYREHEIEQLSKDIAFVLSELQSLFKLKVNDSVDERTEVSHFHFKHPVPLRARSKFYKAKRAREEEETGEEADKLTSETPDSSVAPSRAVDVSPDDEGDHDLHFTVDVGVHELPAATLGGHQTRTHKVHALTMIPEQIETLGSLDVGSSRIFETLHRLVKAYTRRSNKAKLGATERQVIRNSVHAVHRPVCSVKARLYNEKHANMIPSGNVTPPSEDSDEEESSPLQFVHSGTGTEKYDFFLLNLYKSILSSMHIFSFYTVRFPCPP
jgi:hypothetical protein